jgi:hypothetical protein
MLIGALCPVALGSTTELRTGATSPAAFEIRGSRRPGSIASVELLPVAALLALLSGSAFAAEPEADVGEIERLYVEGQNRYEASDYMGAAASWTELLDALPEEEESRVVRESVVVNVLDAHRTAYERLLDEQGNRVPEHLEAGLDVVATYRAAFAEAYGPDAAISAAVQVKMAELEDMLQRHHEPPRQDWSCLAPCLQPCLSPPLDDPRGCGAHRQPSAVVLLLLGPLGFIRRRRDAIEHLADALPPDVLNRLRDADDE